MSLFRFLGNKIIHFLLFKALHTQPPLNTTPLNPPDSVKETLSWLQVPLWYRLCWPFPDHIGWLYTCWTAVWQDLHKRLYCNSFPPLSSHPFCNDTYNLMFSRKVGWHSADTHSYSRAAYRPGAPDKHGWCDSRGERDGTRLWIFLFLLLTLDLISTFAFSGQFYWTEMIALHRIITSKWWTCSTKICCNLYSWCIIR